MLCDGAGFEGRELSFVRSRWRRSLIEVSGEVAREGVVGLVYMRLRSRRVGSRVDSGGLEGFGVVVEVFGMFLEVVERGAVAMRSGLGRRESSAGKI